MGFRRKRSMKYIQIAANNRLSRFAMYVMQEQGFGDNVITASIQNIQFFGEHNPLNDQSGTVQLSSNTVVFRKGGITANLSFPIRFYEDPADPSAVVVITERDPVTLDQKGYTIKIEDAFERNWTKRQLKRMVDRNCNQNTIQNDILTAIVAGFNSSARLRHEEGQSHQNIANQLERNQAARMLQEDGQLDSLNDVRIVRNPAVVQTQTGLNSGNDELLQEQEQYKEEEDCRSEYGSDPINTPITSTSNYSGRQLRSHFRSMSRFNRSSDNAGQMPSKRGKR